MKRNFDYLRITRGNLLHATESLSLKQVNQIPTGFSNNIIWNMGHLLVTQYLLCYGLSGQAYPLDPKYVAQFRKGTKPEGDVDADSLAYLRQELLSAPVRMEQDYNSGLFTQFKVYRTSYNIELQNTEDAIQFNNIHEGLHFGYVLALKKALGI